MPKRIRIDITPLNHIFSKTEHMARKLEIELRKTAIYQYRNQLLSQQLNRQIENSDFEKTEYGKPYLNQFPAVSMNHSHSQKMYVLATVKHALELGVDVEDLDRKVRFDALAQHAFHPEEYQAWKALDDDPHFWFKVWTTKEAILKASGLGIRMQLKDLNTGVHRTQNGGIFEHDKIGVFAYQNFELANCMLTVAWRSEHSCKGFNFPQIELIQH